MTQKPGKQLLGVQGSRAMAGASSHIFIRTPQHTGHPQPVLSRSASVDLYCHQRFPANRVRDATAFGAVRLRKVGQTGLFAFLDFDGISVGGAVHVRAEDNPFSVGRKSDVGFQVVVMFR
jgi:hypothetical protein